MRASILLVLTLGGCASVSVNVPPTYIPDSTYETMGCDAITQELRLAHLRVEALANAQDSLARSDVNSLGLGLLFVQGNRGGHAGALSVAKGQRDALIRVSTAKRCGEKSASPAT